MEPDGALGPTTYCNSLYTHEVDEKRRIQIPSKWRPVGGGAELTLITWLTGDKGPCIRAMYPEQMATLMKDLNAMPNSDPNKVVLKRFIGSKSTQATLDKSGRICLPEEMARTAGITKQAVLVGLLDRFEIWSPERWSMVQASDAILAQEAFKLMG
jgi:MraZ protein